VQSTADSNKFLFNVEEMGTMGAMGGMGEIVKKR